MFFFDLSSIKKINWKIRDVDVSLFMEENLNNVSAMERYNAS